MKKFVKIALVVGVAAFIVTETKAGSYIRAWADRVCKKFEKEITPEQELVRIRHEVELLDGDIDKVKGELAEARVNARLMRAEVEELREAARESDAAVRKHGEVVKSASAEDRIQWGYRNVSYLEAKELLQMDVKRHRALLDRLKARESALAAQEQTRDLIEAELDEMLKQKDELASAVAELEAEVKLAKVEQVRSKRQNDGSRMADIKKSIADVRKKMMVQREERTIKAQRIHRSPAENRSVEEILGELDGVASKAKTSTVDEVRVITKE